MLPELLQRTTPMKVLLAKDGLKVKPNEVYVIPPNKSLSILKGVLHLFDPVETRGLRLPIDIFFNSLAFDQKEKSVGILLSGMGSDGSLGLKAIKNANGLALVQDPATAKFDPMPTNAINMAMPHVVAPAEELGARLMELVMHIATKTDPVIIDAQLLSELEKVTIVLRDQTGHDFSQYKKNTLNRRVERRKDVHLITETKDYIRLLHENPKECELLFKELLIGVTNFFRVAAVWKELKENILPALIEKLPAGATLRARVTACSTGEEAYSLAILCKEVIEKSKKKKRITIQIFASDIDADAINYARKGFYSANIAKDVSPERINQFFIPEGDGYRVQPSLQEILVFAPHNIIQDPPFIELDLLTCRNLLIYLEPQQQQQLVNLFNYRLNPGGILVLGLAETCGTDEGGLEYVNSKIENIQAQHLGVKY